MSRNNNIFLLGFMGAGKSAVGKALAAKLNRRFIDTDDLIESKFGKSINSIFEDDGEEFFRDLESSALEESVMQTDAVISCGGGIILLEKNRETIRKSGTSLFLNASPDLLLSRLKNQKERPLINGYRGEEKLEKIKELLSERLPLYLKADFKFDSGGKSPESLAEEIILKLEES